jgi:hypothetical protein
MACDYLVPVGRAIAGCRNWVRHCRKEVPTPKDLLGTANQRQKGCLLLIARVLGHKPIANCLEQNSENVHLCARESDRIKDTGHAIFSWNIAP